MLLTADDLMRRGHYRNAQRTLDRLLELGMVPVINENDTVATDEIRFGDNDRLAALVAHVTRASALILLSDVDGLYDGDPSQGGARRIEVVASPDDLAHIKAGKTGQGGVGTGGMSTKVDSALIATAAGIPTVVTAAIGGGGRAGGRAAPAPTSPPPASARAPGCYGWPTRPSPGAASRSTTARSRPSSAAAPPCSRPGITGVDGRLRGRRPGRPADENGTVVARGLVNYDAKEIPGLMGRSTRWLVDAS